jgi:hypothetical protein
MKQIATTCVTLCFVLGCFLTAASGGEKQLGPPSKLLTGHYWDAPFEPTTAFGSYNSIFLKPDGKIVNLLPKELVGKSKFLLAVDGGFTIQ